MFTSIAAKVSAKIAALRDADDGATAVEYGLIVGIIAVAIVTALALLTPALGDALGTITTQLGTVG